MAARRRSIRDAVPGCIPGWAARLLQSRRNAPRRSRKSRGSNAVSPSSARIPTRRAKLIAAPSRRTPRIAARTSTLAGCCMSVAECRKRKPCTARGSSPAARMERCCSISAILLEDLQRPDDAAGSYRAALAAAPDMADAHFNLAPPVRGARAAAGGGAALQRLSQADREPVSAAADARARPRRRD